jgi:hypothetical protein
MIEVPPILCRLPNNMVRKLFLLFCPFLASKSISPSLKKIDS